MPKKQEIQLFEEKKVRTVWDSETEQWYFCVVDVVEALTDSVNPSDYIKKMKKRDPSLAEGWGQIVTPLSVQTQGGKQRVNCASPQGLFRLIQSIPSPKAEPFKIWMAQGRQRCESRTKTVGEQNREVRHFGIQGKRLSVADGG
ncbi:MAG: Bro-N domain-containing protein [Bacteroidales bacterium]|nr:Bro-N domain-containing protein [Bacteroidales bacterium]